MTRPANQILIASRNPGKTQEFRELLGNDFELLDLSGYPAIQEIAETGVTFLENAQLKAVTVSREVDLLVLADDSGLEVDALEGAPGVFSARYSGEGATSSSNMARLLSELRSKEADPSKCRARFRCVVVLAKRGKMIGHAEGVVEGEIVEPPRGSLGFGYDPVFKPLGFRLTFGELPAATKNAISHRAKAIQALRASGLLASG